MAQVRHESVAARRPTRRRSDADSQAPSSSPLSQVLLLTAAANRLIDEFVSGSHLAESVCARSLFQLTLKAWELRQGQCILGAGQLLRCRTEHLSEQL